MTEVIDLDAIAPESGRTVRRDGTDYPVRDPLDIPMDEVEEMERLQQSMAGLKWTEQVTRSRRIVQIIIPTLPEEVLHKLTGRQIVQLVVSLMGMVPLQNAPAETAEPEQVS